MMTEKNEQNEKNEQTFQTAGMTPGQMLSQAREARGWAIANISEYTRLSVQCIRDIEADDYRHMAAPVYLHGYFRSYARVVGIPEEAVIDAFKSIEHEYNREPATSPFMPSADDGVPIYKQSGSFKSKKILRWGSLAVVVCLVALVMLWWHDQRSQNTNNVLTTSMGKAMVMPNNTEKKIVLNKAAVKKNQAATPIHSIEKTAPVVMTSTTSVIPASASATNDTKLAPSYTVTPVSNDNAGD